MTGNKKYYAPMRKDDLKVKNSRTKLLFTILLLLSIAVIISCGCTTATDDAKSNTTGNTVGNATENAASSGFSDFSQLNPGFEEKITYEICFGLSKPDGTIVTEIDWNNFVDEEIVPRFPEGFTILNSTGYWQDYNTNVTISESSKIVIVYADFSEGNIQKIIDIRDVYMNEFEQDSVMIAVSDSYVSF